MLTQLEFGNGAAAGADAQPQLSPKAEQLARIDERQKYEDALDAGLDLSKARLNLLRALGHMQDWLNELHASSLSLPTPPRIYGIPASGHRRVTREISAFTSLRLAQINPRKSAQKPPEC